MEDKATATKQLVQKHKKYYNAHVAFFKNCSLQA